MTRASAPCPVSRALTLEAAAERLGITEGEALAMLLAGRLKGCVVRGRQRVTEASVRHWEGRGQNRATK